MAAKSGNGDDIEKRFEGNNATRNNESEFTQRDRQGAGMQRIDSVGQVVTLGCKISEYRWMGQIRTFAEKYQREVGCTVHTTICMYIYLSRKTLCIKGATPNRMSHHAIRGRVTMHGVSKRFGWSLSGDITFQSKVQSVEYITPPLFNINSLHTKITPSLSLSLFSMANYFSSFEWFVSK